MALQFMRRHRRWLFGFLWLVILAFIILYIPAFQGDDDQGLGAAVAEVGDERITVGQFQRTYLRQRQMYQGMYQGRLSDEMLRRLGLEEQTLQALVDERILALEAARLGIRVDDDTLRRHLATAPEFQQDGRFLGAKEIRSRLERQGISVREFEESLRMSLLRERLVALVTDGVKVAPAEAEREFRRKSEQIRAEYVLVPAQVAAVTVSDEEVRARFEAGKDAYRLPERRVVRLLAIDPMALQSRVTLTDADRQAYYAAHRDEFQEEEEVCASHVLVKAKATPDAPEGHPDDEARRLAQAALDRARAGGDFAEIARTASEDQGSAAQGGDLGCFTRGRMLPEFDNAAFALGVGEMSDLVKTSFGYHVIKVTSKKAERTPELAQVKDRIQQMLLTERTSAMVEEKAEAVAQMLSAGKSLEDAAQAHGLAVQKVGPVARADAALPLAAPPVLARAFELEKGKTAPEPLRVGTGAVFLAVDDIQSPRAAEFSEVQEKVKKDVLEAKAFAAAHAVATDLSARAQKDGLEKAASSFSLVRKQTDALVSRGQPLGDLGTSGALDEAAYALTPLAVSGPIRTPAGWAVVRVLEKTAYDPVAFEREKTALIATLTEERKDQMFRSFMQEARKRFPVQRRPDLLKRVTS